MKLVSMIDVLAVLRPGVDVDLVCLRLRGGATFVLSIREILHDGDLWLRLDQDADGGSSATLQSGRRDVPSEAVTSMRTVRFAEFVGAGQSS